MIKTASREPEVVRKALQDEVRANTNNILYTVCRVQDVVYRAERLRYVTGCGKM